jgi:hypothetical protein
MEKIRCEICGSKEYHFNSNRQIIRCPLERAKDLQGYFNDEVKNLYSGIFTRDYLSKSPEVLDKINTVCSNMFDFNDLFKIEFEGNEPTKTPRIHIKSAIIEGDLRILLLNFMSFLNQVYNVNKFHYNLGYQPPLKGYFSYTYLSRGIIDSIKRFASKGTGYLKVQDCLNSNLLIYTTSSRQTDDMSLSILNDIMDGRVSSGKAIWVFKTMQFKDSYEHSRSHEFREIIKNPRLIKKSLQGYNLPQSDSYFNDSVGKEVLVKDNNYNDLIVDDEDDENDLIVDEEKKPVNKISSDSYFK